MLFTCFSSSRLRVGRPQPRHPICALSLSRERESIGNKRPARSTRTTGALAVVPTAGVAAERVAHGVAHGAAHGTTQGVAREASREPAQRAALRTSTAKAN